MPKPQQPTSQLRIIGGKLRGSKLSHPGEPGTRPMKDRVREAVFNLLGKSVAGTLAIDLFAGTGAMALEAISRGATRAIAIEKHFPMARTVKENAAALGVADAVTLHAGDAFIWGQSLTPDSTADWTLPTTVFCCPPYALYDRHQDRILALLQALTDFSRAGGTLVVEADDRFDYAELPHPDEWDVRLYPPAHVGVYRFEKS